MRKSSSSSESDDDSFLLDFIKTKNKNQNNSILRPPSSTQQNFQPQRSNMNQQQPSSQHIQIPSKRTQADIQAQKTKKHSQDPTMNHLYQSLLRQSDKFKEDTPTQQRKQVQETNPHVVNGKLKKIRTCSAQERKTFGLEDQGYCQIAQLNEFVIALIGKIGYTPIQGINANIFLPKRIYKYLNSKSHLKQTPPKGILPLSQGRYLIKIKREIIQNQKDFTYYPYLILDPITLLYPTYLCSWIDCKRRISLCNYIQGQSQINQALVYGSTCHRLLQWLAQDKVTLKQFYALPQKIADKLYDSMLYDMYLIDKTNKDFKLSCNRSLHNIAGFYNIHIVQQKQLKIDNIHTLKITKVLASQYMFRSSYFGLKGKVDLLLAGKLITSKGSQDVCIPMQLKTGKRISDAHKKQTDIYTMLVRQKYQQKTVGLLYYSQTDTFFFRMEDPLLVYGIIMLHRNQICQNIVRLWDGKQGGKANHPQAPQTLPQCNYCEQAQMCELGLRQGELDGAVGTQSQNTTQSQQQNGERKLQSENGVETKHKSFNTLKVLSQPTQQLSKITKSLKSNTAKTPQFPSSLYPQLLQQINQYTLNQRLYLKKWLQMLHLQQLAFRKYDQDHYQIGISSFVLPHSQMLAFTSSDLNKKLRVEIVHKCRNSQEIGAFQQVYKHSTKLRLIANDIGLLQGCKVVSTNINPILRLFLLTIQFNNANIQLSRGRLNYFIQTKTDIDVDVETFQNGFFATMRGTVFRVIGTQSHVRDIVLEDSPRDIKMNDENIEESQLQGLNSDQQKAYRMSVNCQQFCLIEGMPGTGKTQLIIKLIAKFTKMHKKVLVTTFTNRSLDNILQRITDRKLVPQQLIIRQGSKYSTSPLLQKYTSKTHQFTSLQDYKLFYSSKQIWMVTLNSLNIHHIPKQFDVVIIDQASQCLQPLCLDGVLKGDKFIMIGDYKQLQPVIKSKPAFRKGMWVSLFQRLCKMHPGHSVGLKKQYRMNREIMALSNQLVYDGQLQPAYKELEARKLNLNQDWKNIVPQSFRQVFDPSLPVRFINYDPIIDAITAAYQPRQKQIRKVIQTQIPAFLFKTMIKAGVPASQVSVIAPMNSSVNKIIQLLRTQGILQQNQGRILTIDKSQGIDKEAIILLIQKGNQELIQNPRRLNVGLTRAKSKLIVVGSADHLEKMRVFGGTLGKMMGRYRVELEKGMIESMVRSFGEIKDK